MTQLVIPAELGGLLQATAGYSQFPSVCEKLFSLLLMVFAKSSKITIMIVSSFAKNLQTLAHSIFLHSTFNKKYYIFLNNQKNLH